MNLGFLAAGGLSAFALVWHLMTGRSRPLPLLGKDQGQDWMLADAWFGRHTVTLLLAAMAMGFPNAARAPEGRDVALVLGALALGLAALRVLFAVRIRAPRLDLAEWALPAAAGLAAIAGLYL